MSQSPFRFLNRRARWLLAAIVTLALYWRDLHLPFFWDDVANFEFLSGRSFLRIWTDATGFPYYRPVLFTLWQLGLTLLPPAPTVIFHALNLIVHALNAALVGELTLHLLRRGSPNSEEFSHRLAAALATLLYAVLPFAVLPVSLAASLFHVSATCAALGAVVAAMQYTHTSRWRWFGLALFLAALAPFVHETGVIAGTAAALAVIITSRRLTRAEKWLIVLLPLAGAVFLPIWFSVPKARGGFEWVGWESIWAGLTFFTQSLTYPFQPLAGILVMRWRSWDLGAVWAVTLPALLGAAVILLRPRFRHWRVLAFALGWFALTILPSVLLLPYYYVYLSMRLLYLPGVMGAALWASVAALLAERAARPGRQAFVALALASVAVVPNVIFVRQEVSLHELALRPIWQVAEISRQYPNEKHLVINPMDWVAYKWQWYPIGHEGVEIMPSYVTLRQLAVVNGGEPAVFRGMIFEEVQHLMESHFVGLNGTQGVLDWEGFARNAETYDRVWVVQPATDQINVIEAGSVQVEQSAEPKTFLANFESSVFLNSGEFDVAGGEVRVTLNWTYLGPDPQAAIFRHVFDCAGNVLGLGDGPALEGMLPFAFVKPGSLVRDVRHIPLTAPSADGCYYVEVGLFRADGSRVAAAAPDASAFENALVTLSQITP